MGIKQVLPLPPAQYEQGYLQQLVRAMTDYIEQMSNPGPVVCSSLRILQCPRSGGGLPQGSVWARNGVLYIVDSSYGSPGGVTAVGSVGTVTVTTV